MRISDMQLPEGYSVVIGGDGATLYRNGEVLNEYGPGWSPLCVVHDAWEHAVEIEHEIQKLNDLFGRV